MASSEVVASAESQITCPLHAQASSGSAASPFLASRSTGKVDDHRDSPTGYGSNKSNQPSSYVVILRGNNYRASRVDTLSGYHNTITAASREKGNTVGEWPHNTIIYNTTIIIQRHKVNDN